MSRHDKHRSIVAIVAGLVLSVALVTSSVGLAQSVPWANQALLLMRVLAYDRNLATRAGGSAVIVVVYDSGSDSSRSAKTAITAAFEKFASSHTIAGETARVVPVAYGNDFERELAGAKAVAAYLCPSLDGVMSSITRATRSQKVLTLAGERGYVRSGASIGVVPEAGKAKVVVNLEAARAEGADLPAAFLRVAEVLQ